MRAARARGADEALRRDRDGWVATGATSNLVAVVGGRIVDAGDRRGHPARRDPRPLLALWPATAGHPIDERSLTDAELVGADALVITSSIRGVVPVADLTLGDARRAWSGPDPIARSLIGAYDEYVAEVATRGAG